MTDAVELTRYQEALKAAVDALAEAQTKLEASSRENVLLRHGLQLVDDALAVSRDIFSSQGKAGQTNLAELSSAIEDFELEFPGWWWSVCHCQLTRDASCGPDFRVLGENHRHTIAFDDGFHDDNEGSLADALREVARQAREAIAEYEAAQ